MNLKLLKIPSDPQQIQIVETYLKKVANSYKVCEDKYPDMLISLTEAVNNAIIHGNKQNRSKFVEIHLEEKDAGLAFHVSDEGSGFDPNKIPDPTSTENIECCGGRGVFIMQHLSDRMNFSNHGRTVEMFFKLT